MIEPYTSLIWWIAGCLLVVVACEVTAIRGTSKLGAWRNRLKWVHVPVWVLIFTLFTVTCTIAQVDVGAFGIALGIVGIAGFACLLIVVLEGITRELDLSVLRPFSAGLLFVMLIGLILNSFMTDGKGFRSVSAEYTVSSNGTRMPVASETHELKRVGSTEWVTVAAVEHKRSGRDNGSEIRTVYTWNEVRGTETVAKTTTREQDDVSVVEDVAAGKAAWVEYIPVYYLAPSGIFDGTRPDPVQGSLCVQGRDTGCKANAQRAYTKYVLHVPASAK